MVALRGGAYRQEAASPGVLAEGPTAHFPWPQAIVLAVAAVVFVASIAEIALRVVDLHATNLAALQCVGSSTSLQSQKGLFVLDDQAGYVMRQDACVRLKTTEYDGILRTNSQGMVGPEVPPAK